MKQGLSWLIRVQSYGSPLPDAVVPKRLQFHPVVGQSRRIREKSLAKLLVQIHMNQSREEVKIW